MIEKIMLEGRNNFIINIEHSQNHKQRIKQTLSSSAHSMSMLYDYRIGKEIEKIKINFLKLNFYLIEK